MPRLDPFTVAQLKRRGRCPDCDSIVRVDRDAGRVNVEHDDSCPMWAQLRRERRTTQLVFARPPGVSAEDFARTVADALKALSADGLTAKFRTDPYGMAL